MLGKRLVLEDPHHIPHSVPDITGDVVQVDYPAHAGDEGNHGLWWDMAVHDNTQYMSRHWRILFSLLELQLI